MGVPERKCTIRMREGWTSVLDSVLGLSLLEAKAQGYAETPLHLFILLPWVYFGRTGSLCVRIEGVVSLLVTR